VRGWSALVRLTKTAYRKHSAALEAAGKAAVQNAKPLSQNAYKVTLAKVAVKRALLEAAKAKG